MIILESALLSSDSDVKESASNAGDLGSIPGLGSSPGEGNGKSLQYSCLENPIDRGAWQATVGLQWQATWGHKESDTTERIHRHTQTDTHTHTHLTLYLGNGKRRDVSGQPGSGPPGWEPPAGGIIR